MIKPVNPGAILPMFLETASPLAHSRQVSFHADGWKILGSNRKLLPFIFWQSGAADSVVKFQVINIGTGKVHDLSTSLIDRRRRTDNTKTWYLFDGSDIGETLPCGVYKIRVELVLASFISDEIEVINAWGPEYIGLLDTGCTSDVLSLQGSDTIASAISYQRTEYRISNATAWTAIPTTGTGPYTYDLDLSTIVLPAGENVIIRRTIQTTAGNTLRTIHTLDYTNADPCGTRSLLLVNDKSVYANGDLWYLELADSPLWDDKIYESGFVERVYLRGHWDFPEVEREVEVFTDNIGGRVLNTADTKEFLTMDFEKVADHLLYKLSTLGDYSTLSLDNVSRNYSITGIPGAETTFSSQPDAGGYYSRGRIRFRENKHFETTCTDSETTIAI